ncbi:MAG: UDP-N-acetylmuramate--L-alanine ligase [Limnochordia bacterium]|nr:UDP-N-acetylmuramate--L-alanine ligase [Limnochordia bacterium]
MSGLAIILLQMGCQVTGSDLADSERLANLRRLGARIKIGHARENVEQPDCIVVSSAVPKDNVEVQKANAEGIPVLKRAELLALLMKRHRGVAVAGTHGKTTTTSMLALLLQETGYDPTIIIGGECDDIGSNARLGTGLHMVAEADESDASFLYLSPHIAVITNIEADHLDNYRDAQAVEDVFLKFVNRIVPEGYCVACTDDAGVGRLLAKASCPRITYGIKTGAVRACDLNLTPFGSRFTVKEHGVSLGEVALKVPGKHNILNALAAICVGLAEGIPFADLADAIGKFRGARRRFEVLTPGDDADILVIDDYAHHPTEIKATIDTASRIGRRLVTVFQPHRYSRTSHFLTDFAGAFAAADTVVITEIYAASETPIDGISGEVLAQRMGSQHKDVEFVANVDELPEFLMGKVQSKDLVLFMGAGSITNAARRFAQLVQGSLAKQVG